jgi:LysR family hydrogen peroxide-inducible transcriptional activator
MRQLRYVVTVVSTGNFCSGADECRVSQPSLSQQILKLEEELGERVSGRIQRAAQLIQHGEAFLRRA